jgi:hypothetical protein
MIPSFDFSTHKKVVFQTANSADPLQTAQDFGGIRVLFGEDPNEVEAQRRRRGSGSGPSGRAEMPGRPSSSGRTGGGPFGSGGSGGGMFNRSGGGRGLPLGLVLLIALAYFVFNLLSNPDSGSPSDLQSTPQDYQPQVSATLDSFYPQTETPFALPTTAFADNQLPSGTAGPAKTWTVLLYADADDPNLEQDIYTDINEAEMVGSNAQVNIVVQLDRYAGGFSGDGDWTTARRYYLTKDSDLSRLKSKMLADLGEVSMADPKTLVDFATWGIKTYPADKYVLILSDHGMGWPGGLVDPKPATHRNVDAPFAQTIDENMMYTNDIDQALAQIRQQTGLDKFELIGMDACLMSHLEVYSALAPHTRYVVSSQETEPALGWAYTGFLTALENNPGMDGAELGRQIVASYIVKDERIVDKEARLEFLRQGSPLGSLFSQPADVDPQQLSQQIGKSITLTAARMDAVPALMDSVNQLAFALQKENQAVPARARSYAQTYTSIFGSDVPPSYIDLGSFAQLLQKESTSAAIRSAASAVLDKIKQVVVAEKHGPEKPGATGISIYFPNSQLYQSAMAGASSYTIIADRFARDSLWDEFLAYHYTKTSFKDTTGNAAVPGKNTRVTAPGNGQIEVSPIKLSLSRANYDQPVTMEATLKGTNIGYVYLFVGYYDPSSKSILVADKDYLESPKTQQLGDLYYPAWTDNQSFKLKYTWTPSVFAIDDGRQTVVALLKPERYGASAEEAVYSTDGYYVSAGAGQSRYARMYFSNGTMTHVYGFNGQDASGPLHEIIPQSGDQITLIQTWLEADGSGGYREVKEDGKTLTFSDQMFTWKELYAASGDYAIGFVVSDLDGNEKTILGSIHIN